MNGVIVFTVREGMISDFLYTDNPNPAEAAVGRGLLHVACSHLSRRNPSCETLGTNEIRPKRSDNTSDKLCKEYWESLKATPASTSDRRPGESLGGRARTAATWMRRWRSSRMI